MTIMILTALIGLALGVARGGRLQNVANVRLAGWWLIALALIAEATLALAPGGARALIVIASCGAALAWCALNTHEKQMMPGMILLGVGILANIVIIGLNGGMPVSLSALASAGFSRHANVTHGYLLRHVAMTVHTHLGFLGDRIPVAALRTVLSPGDLLMLAGIFLITWRATGIVRSQHSENGALTTI